MKSKVYLENDGITYVISIGDQTAEEVIEVREEVLRLNENNPGKIKILNDLSKMGRSLPGGRVESSKSIKLEKVGKVAIFGANTINRVLATFIIRASGMSEKVKCFNTKEEAIKWLKE